MQMDNSMIYAERRRRFTLLLSRYKDQTEAAEALGFGGPAAVSNYKLRKNMGEDVARRIEEKAGLPRGSMIDPLSTAWDVSNNHVTLPASNELRHPASISDGEDNKECVQDYAVIESYELWSGATTKELRHMVVPTEWLQSEGLTSDQLKSITMPDDSQSDRIRRGDYVAVNIEWGGTLKNDVTYAVKIGGEYTLRRVAWQANGGLILRCRNDDYPDEVVNSEDVESLDILGSFARFQGVTI